MVTLVYGSLGVTVVSNVISRLIHAALRVLIGGLFLLFLWSCVNSSLIMTADEKIVPTSCKVVLAGMVAKDLLTEVIENVSGLGKSPLLVGFLANTDPAARKYADWTDRTCREK